MIEKHSIIFLPCCERCSGLRFSLRRRPSARGNSLLPFAGEKVKRDTFDDKKSTARIEEELENLCGRISLTDREKAGLTIF